MFSQLDANPVRSFLMRYQSVLVLLMGFAGAFLLGLVLWTLSGPMLGAAAAPPVVAPADNATTNEAVVEEAPPAEAQAVALPAAATTLSPVFTAEVRHWEPQIVAWAAEHELDPNLVATLMQIESCGNPQAVSYAGAQGLFQVMPFHFGEGEVMLDPDTNARRGLDYMTQSLVLTEGHVGMAFAGYNGGHVAAEGTWDYWADETRRYYRWGSGLYYDASSGLGDSPTLHDWLTAGGASLCQQAAAQLGLQ